MDDLIARGVLAIRRVGERVIGGARWGLMMDFCRRGDKTQFSLKIKVLAKIKHLDIVERQVLF